MGLSIDKVFLLKNIFSKIKYDSLSGKYQILPEVYLSFKLSSKQMKLLEEMCVENNIELVKLPKKLTDSEALELFIKYNELKNELNLEHTNKEKIMSEIYKVRNEIALGYMELIYKIILKYYPNISEIADKEDIFQSGYEVLLDFIERFDTKRTESFSVYLSKYFILYFLRCVSIFSDNITIDENNKLHNLIKKRKSYSLKYNKEPTISELIQITGYSKEEIELLLMLEKNIVHISMEDLVEDDKEDTISEFVDLGFDDLVSKSLNNSYIRKIIETLPDVQKNCILLYFGFDGGPGYTYDELGDKLGISREAARQAVLRALNSIKDTVRGRILSVLLDENNLGEKNVSLTEENIDLTYYLIEQIPRKIVLELLADVKEKNKEVFMLMFGLTDGKKYSRDEVCEKMGISKNCISYRLGVCIEALMHGLKNRYINKYNGTQRENFSILENLMFDYVNCSKGR